MASAFRVPDAATRLDADGLIVIPGLINAHTHGHNNLARGLAGRWTLEHLISFGPAIQANWTAEDHYLSAALGAIEMLRTGATAAYDLYMAVPVADESVLEPVIDAYRDVGLRVVLAPSMADGPFHRIMPGLQDVVPANIARRLERLAVACRRHGYSSWRNRRSDASTVPPPVVYGSRSHRQSRGCAATSSCAGLAALAREHGVGMHTHVAESRVQVAHAKRPMGKADRLRVGNARCAAAAASPPRTASGSPQRRSGYSRMPAQAWSITPPATFGSGAGSRPFVGCSRASSMSRLGSDGSVSSDNQDMFEAMRLAALVSRADPRIADPAGWIDAADAFERATVAGARAIGCEGQLGEIEPDRLADLVLLRGDSMFLKPRNDLLNALVFAENGLAVDTVIVDGRVVMQGGRVLGVDEAAIRDRAQQSAERLAHTNRELFAGAQELAPYIWTHCQALIGAGDGPAVVA